MLSFLLNSNYQSPLAVTRIVSWFLFPNSTQQKINIQLIWTDQRNKYLPRIFGILKLFSSCCLHRHFLIKLLFPQLFVLFFFCTIRKDWNSIHCNISTHEKHTSSRSPRILINWEQSGPSKKWKSNVPKISKSEPYLGLT